MTKKIRNLAALSACFLCWIASAADVNLFHTAPLPGVSLSMLNEATVTAFAGQHLAAAMHGGKIPGLVFVVVRGDKVLCEKACGFANLENRMPVSTSNTLFRVASISKIMTAASVLQLVHQHLLNLHQNVNRYLSSFRIAPAFGAPITLFDLLTHSSGFDVCHLDYAARIEAQKLSLRRYLAEFQPVRIRRPGLFSGYDNYGYALAGYLVQRISGISFPDYMEEHLLQPLDMDHSSFTPDPALRRELATGYRLEDGNLHPDRQTHVNITPAAGLCSTASDMSLFLTALLTDRCPNGDRAFPESVLHGLETQQFDFNPEVPGRCYGFDEAYLDGRQVLRQTGQWPGFNSLLLLAPQQHCGLFIAYNRCDQLHLGWQIARRFAQQFIPLPENIDAARQQAGLRPATLDRFCGSYLSVRYAEDSVTLGVPPGIEVRKAQAGQLEIGGHLYRELGPTVFEQIAPGGIPGRRVVFRIGSNGRIADLITEGAAFRRVPWPETRQGRRTLMCAASLVFISVLTIWPITFVIRYGNSKTLEASGLSSAKRCREQLSWWIHGAAIAACVLALWLEVSLPLAEWRLGPFADFYGLPSSIRHTIETMPLLILLTFALAGFSVIAWWKRFWSPTHCLHYSLIPMALGVVLYVFYCQHLLFVTLPGKGLI